MIRFTIALAVLFTASPAWAGLTYTQSLGGSPTFTPTYANESTSRILVEFVNGATLVQQSECWKTCSYTPPDEPYTDFSTQLVGFDPAREEVVSTSCSGTDLDNFRCSNGYLDVQLRVITGDRDLESRFNLDGYPSTGTSLTPTLLFSSGGTVKRYYFSGNHDFYWDGKAGDIADNFPAGTYDVEVRHMPYGECKPALQQPFTEMTVVAHGGQSPKATIYYLPTLCQYEFTNEGAHVTTITASTGGSCTVDGDADTCVVEVPFAAQNVLFSAESTSTTHEPYFHDPQLNCSEAWSTIGTCFETLVDGDPSIEIEYLDKAAYGHLTVSAGSVPPADRSVALGSTDNAVAHFTVTPSNGTPTIGRLIIFASGTGHHNPDLTQTHIYVDANNNGLHDDGEEEAGHGVFSTTTGNASITLNYAVAAPTNFAVTVDINNELAAGVTVPFAPWSLILVVAVPVLVLYRRRRMAMGLAAVLLVVGAAYACGGGGSQDTDDQQQTDNGNNNGDDDTTDDDGTDNGPTDNDPGPDEVTLGFTIGGMADTGAIIEGLPLVGATLVVHR